MKYVIQKNPSFAHFGMIIYLSRLIEYEVRAIKNIFKNVTENNVVKLSLLVAARLAYATQLTITLKKFIQENFYPQIKEQKLLTYNPN